MTINDINSLKDDLNIKIKELVDLESEDAKKLFRTLAKRPAIVAIYSAGDRTIEDYIIKECNKSKLSTLSLENKKELAAIIVTKALTCLEKEMMMMEYFQNMMEESTTGTIE